MVTVTGVIKKPDGVPLTYYPSRVEFELSGVILDGDVIVPRSVVANIGVDGSFSVVLWPNDVGVTDTYYAVYAVAYETDQYINEVYRQFLGSIRVLDIAGQTLDVLLNNGAANGLPDHVAVLYIHDNAGSDELWVRFSNGVTKKLAGDVA